MIDIPYPEASEVKGKLRDILKPAITLFVICVVVSAALGFTYSGTKNVIEERKRLDEIAARKEVLGTAKTFEADERLADIVNGKPELNMVEEAYKGLNGETVEGYVITAVSKGYGGDVKVIVGIDSSKTISGVKIVEHSETPGLGAKAEDPEFLSQFVNTAPKKPLKLVKGNKVKAEEIDAISSATITSKAVTDAVQAAVGVANELMDEGGSSK